jgi:hypothetical protein
MRAWRLPSGRIHVAWSDGWGGSAAKFSDDDGYTWVPCKDASLASPRPFYTPDLTELAKPPGQRPRPPRQILPWPATPVSGSVLLPYGDHVAVLGGELQIFDGQQWSKPAKMPWSVPYSASATTAAGRIFIAVGGKYGNVAKRSSAGKLEVAELADGKWKTAVLEAGGVGDTILTASGDAVFCFYVKLGGEDGADTVCYRRWAGGRWGEAKTLAAESFIINRLGAPVISAPDYAAIFWDQHRTDRKQKLKLRFAKVPNVP